MARLVTNKLVCNNVLGHIELLPFGKETAGNGASAVDLVHLDLPTYRSLVRDA